MKILHISVHLGGGVGTVLRNWIKKDLKNEHTILVLNSNFYGSKEEFIHENMRNRFNEINEFIIKSDIVVIHFWNHPFLFEFLINSNLPKCRVCIWSHISGIYPPYVHTEKLVNFSDRFILASPISNIKYGKEKTSIIWTTGDLEVFNGSIKKRKDDEFIVGYIGTLDYSKIHPNFIDLCEKICSRIPKVNFIICGIGFDKEQMELEVKKRGIDSHFNFPGYVNIKDIVNRFDVFGYPLNKTHFGTCEQVLGEVMISGVYPVVLDNPAEKYIVENYGSVCNTLDEYVDSIVNIYENKITDHIILNLQKRAKDLYDINNMINSWNNIFSNIIKEEKKIRRWEPKSTEGYKIFIESLGEFGIILENENEEEIKRLFNSNNQFRSKSKGSIYQYLDSFPDDKKLKEWSKL